MFIDLEFNCRLAQTVKFMVSLGLLMTYPLQFFVAIQIMWSAIEEKHGPLRHPLYSQLIFRALLVLVTCKFVLITEISIFFFVFTREFNKKIINLIIRKMN